MHIRITCWRRGRGGGGGKGRREDKREGRREGEEEGRGNEENREKEGRWEVKTGKRMWSRGCDGEGVKKGEGGKGREERGIRKREG